MTFKEKPIHRKCISLQELKMYHPLVDCEQYSCFISCTAVWGRDQAHRPFHEILQLCLFACILLPNHLQIMCLFLKYLSTMNEIWTVSVTRKHERIIWQGIFKVSWFKITIKLWLSNHTNDYANLYLHNKRLLLLEKKKPNNKLA